ncbi:MAG TPA: hypothetical protein VIO61_16665 [Anaerolineaceae bacterium]
MPDPNPLEKEIERFKQLQEKLTLKDVQSALDDIERILGVLPGKVQKARAGDYIYKKGIEPTLTRLAETWDSLRGRVQEEMRRQQGDLQYESYPIRGALDRGQTGEPELTALESKVENVVRSLQAMYTPLQDEARTLQRQVDDVLWTLEQIQQASFSLNPGERPVEAVSANWKKPDDKDGVEGILYLTDQRLLFEQKEEVATKKMLFITTEKKKLQSLQWGVAVSQVEQAAGSKRGFLGKDDYLTLTVTGSAVFRSTDLHLKGESGETWRKFIEQVKSGAILSDKIGIAASPESAFFIYRWGTPVMVSVAGSIARVNISGDYAVSGAEIDSAREPWLRNLLISQVIDIVGEFSNRVNSPQEIAGQKDAITAAALAAAKPAFASQGVTLERITLTTLAVQADQ